MASNSSSPIRVDFHAHTNYSYDGWHSPSELVERAASIGLDRVAVTDHNEIEGALEAHARYPGQVIVGEEVTCRCRTHLIGLFLRERIPPGLPIEETAERIRDQGGIVYAPHPTAYPTRSAWRIEQLMRVADAVEAFNSRALWGPWNRSALAEARRRGLPALAGTDGHFPWEIGRAYTEIPRFTGAADFKAAAQQATAVGLRVCSPLVLVASTVLEIAYNCGIRVRDLRGVERPAVRVG